MGQYYSERNGLAEDRHYNLDDLRDTFVHIHDEFHKRELFRNLYGHTGVIERPDGAVGNDIEAFCLREFGKRHLLPVRKGVAYTENEIFDLIELLYKHVSYLVYNFHKRKVREERIQRAKNEFRTEINNILRYYSQGFELSAEGYVRELVTDGLDELINTKQADESDRTVEEKVTELKQKFLKHSSTEMDKRGAILELAGLLEAMRGDIKEKLNGKDEDEIFLLLNRFGLRHRDLKQVTKYDTSIYYPWIFYYLLASFDAYIKLKSR
ncbi:hypothetical protein [Aneurinibacillus danicus]|uniref:Uncharacterized protein n=1 Tax=Aneurinibacillus danicus TaxID=267746 RepID=A0A511VAP2_9BACL|nr:hypothetical protein [Aneurinibacillus danicus]GEN35919.1 hypothetical protein ADA01nite_33790 [Aneurinibacillus danicus]